jgi:hypothetical protein
LTTLTALSLAVAVPVAAETSVARSVAEALVEPYGLPLAVAEGWMRLRQVRSIDLMVQSGSKCAELAARRRRKVAEYMIPLA